MPPGTAVMQYPGEKFGLARVGEQLDVAPGYYFQCASTFARPPARREAIQALVCAQIAEDGCHRGEALALLSVTIGCIEARLHFRGVVPRDGIRAANGSRVPSLSTSRMALIPICQGFTRDIEREMPDREPVYVARSPAGELEHARSPTAHEVTQSSTAPSRCAHPLPPSGSTPTPAPPTG